MERTRRMLTWLIGLLLVAGFAACLLAALLGGKAPRSGRVFLHDALRR